MWRKVGWANGEFIKEAFDRRQKSNMRSDCLCVKKTAAADSAVSGVTALENLKLNPELGAGMMWRRV